MGSPPEKNADAPQTILRTHVWSVIEGKVFITHLSDRPEGNPESTFAVKRHESYILRLGSTLVVAFWTPSIW